MSSVARFSRRDLGGNPSGAVAGGLQISADGGQTWTADQSFGDRIPGGLPFTDPPNPLLISHGFPGATGFTVAPNSGPWMVVDQSTGDVYVSTTAHPQRYVAVSQDHAATWGRIEAWDCDEHDGGRPGWPGTYTNRARRMVEWRATAPVSSAAFYAADL
jgi:hypothetical protein